VGWGVVKSGNCGVSPRKETSQVVRSPHLAGWVRLSVVIAPPFSQAPAWLVISSSVGPSPRTPRHVRPQLAPPPHNLIPFPLHVPSQSALGPLSTQNIPINADPDDWPSTLTCFAGAAPPRRPLAASFWRLAATNAGSDSRREELARGTAMGGGVGISQSWLDGEGTST